MNHLMASPRSALDPCRGPARPPLASAGSPLPVVAAVVAVRQARVAVVVVVHPPPRASRASSAASPPSGLGTRSLRRSLLALSSSSSLLALPHVSNTRSPVANCSSSRAAIDSSVGTSSFTSFSSSSLSRSSFVPCRRSKRPSPRPNRAETSCARATCAPGRTSRASRVSPLPRLRVYPVHRKKPPRVIRHGVNRPRDVLDLVCARKVRQRHAREPRTQHLRLVQQVRLYVRGGGFVDAQQRACA